MAKSTIDDVLNNKRLDLLSFSFIFALVLATNGTLSLLSNFTYSYHNIGYRSFWQQYIVALLLTIVLSTLLMTGIVMIIMSGSFMEWIVQSGYLEASSARILEYGRGFILLLIVFTSISLLFYVGPTKKKEWRFVSPGSILATSLIIIISFGFSFYIENFSQYNKLYGSIGTLMVIMLWIYLGAIGLVIGFELNASVANAKKSNKEQLELNIKEL